MNTNGDVNEATRPRDLIRHLSGHPGAPRQIADIVLHGLSVVLHGGWWLHFRRRAGRPGRRLRTILSRMVSELLLFEAECHRRATAKSLLGLTNLSQLHAAVEATCVCGEVLLERAKRGALDARTIAERCTRRRSRARGRDKFSPLPRRLNRPPSAQRAGTCPTDG